MSDFEFHEFVKIPRLYRECTITEKIDGMNACILIGSDGEFLTGTRSRWITPETDNFGFSKWAHKHRAELAVGLGVGLHYGEWWGAGIQRRYGLDHKRFSLFNTHLWNDDAVRPPCCHVVPTLYRGLFTTSQVEGEMQSLATLGSKAAPGFMKPEGVVVWHDAAQAYFKTTIEKDAEWKGRQS